LWSANWSLYPHIIDDARTNTHQRCIRTFYLVLYENVTIRVFLVRSILQRSFGSDVWNNLAAFLRSRILKVTIQGVPRSSALNIVTTARIVQRGDNSSRFEVGLELPHESEDTDTAEGRGKFPLWVDFQSKRQQCAGLLARRPLLDSRERH